MKGFQLPKNDPIFMKIDHAMWTIAAVDGPSPPTFHLVQDQVLDLIWFYLWV